MKKDELKNSLDDALSGIKENPWLLTRVLSRAESMEDTPVKKKIAFGTVQVVLTIILLMSLGIASISSLNQPDSLKDKEPIPMTTPAFSGTEAETELARLWIESPVYDGSRIRFTWNLENKKPEVPMWCWVEKITFNGIEDQDLPDIGLEQWVPGTLSGEGSVSDEYFKEVPDELLDAETIHVEMKVNLSRPVRPWKTQDTEDRFREDLEAAIAEGYFVIPSYSGAGEVELEGYFEPEEDLAVCENGWCIAVSGGPLPDDTMGDIIVETLEVSFDAICPKPGNGVTLLHTQEVDENEYCTAVFEKAETTPMGLYLTVRVKPKDASFFPPRYWALEWEGLLDEWRSHGSLNPTTVKQDSRPPEDEGETVFRLFWKSIAADALPDTIYLTARLQNYELVKIPIQVWQPDSLKDNEPIPATEPASSGTEAEGEFSRLQIDSPVYNGTSIDFSTILNQKDPDIPVWCWVKSVSFNGISANNQIPENGCWLMNGGPYQTHWNFRLPYELQGQESIHAEITFSVSRPARPWKILNTNGRFRDELEGLIAEGYYVMPNVPDPDEEEDGWPVGFFVPEEDQKGWTVRYTGGPLPDDTMGDIMEDILVVSADVPHMDANMTPVLLSPQEVYENEYCSAVFERAELTYRGLFLTIRANLKTPENFPPQYWLLSDGRSPLSVQAPAVREYASPDHEGETVWELWWKNIRLYELQDQFSLECRMQNNGFLRFPILVR